MKMTIRRAVKCTGCVRYELPECVEPVPTYIPEEQDIRWMTLYHEKMITCKHHLSSERLMKEIMELGK